jgi:cephalosporin hydroxylase
MRELFEKHTGKSVDKWSAYVYNYDKLLLPYLNRPVNILEIGISNGGSLDIWAEIFQDGNVVGVDIDEKCRGLVYDNPRISVVIGDVKDPETKRAVTDICDTYDIIIDDGSHITSDVIKTFAGYYPLLGIDSLYIMEDLHTSYWTEFGGGLRIPLTSMAFIKHLADIPNYEHWRLNISRREYLKYYERFHEIEFVESELATIHSVSISNSMVVIERRSSDHNDLGKRIVRGEEETVHENAHMSDGTDISFLPVTTQDDWQYEPLEMALRINQLSKEKE